MNIDEIVTSKYLKGSDFPSPKVMRIEKTQWEEVGKERDEKAVVYFQHEKKGLVLNVLNAKTMFALFGTKDLDTWAGREIEVYFDPSVMFAGKIVGGLRVRAPSNPQAVANGQVTLTAEQAKAYAEFLQSQQPAPPHAPVDETGIDQETHIPDGFAQKPPF